MPATVLIPRHGACADRTDGVGYIAVRVLGDRKGIAVAAIAGSLASSTATTLSFARLAREHPQRTRLLASGIFVGWHYYAGAHRRAGERPEAELITALAWPSVAAAAVRCPEVPEGATPITANSQSPTIITRCAANSLVSIG